MNTYTLQPYTLLLYYSYTLYDQLGRITEVGQKYQTTAMTGAISRDTAALAGWIYYNDGSNHYPAEMVTQTVYDMAGVDATACPTALRFVQKSYTLRNRVSYTRYYEKPSYYYDAGAARYYISGATYTTGIDYSYDIHGNVDTMRNLYNAITYSPITYHGYNSCKTIVYKYDLISGKVNEVHYNPGENDEFYHRYEYDAENRLTDVYTTDTKAFIGQPLLEEHDAKYQYYQHGPLARMQAGQQIVQGVDYAYTLQGWLKGINGTAQSATWDMSGDGTGANIYNATDAYTYTLYYFNGDYGAINYSKRPFAEPQAYFPSGEYRPLYNGNISSVAHNIGARFYAQLYNYSYDQLNRLKAMDMYRGLNTGTNQWSSLALQTLYKERYSYDANGNITKALRNGNLSANPLMDSLRYFYKSGTNQLDYIRDKNSGSTAHSSNYGATVDIKDQAAGNYVYNAIGELNYDRISSIDSVKWNVYGKMQHIYKHSATYGTAATGLHYYYDPSGNRTGMAVLYNPSTSYNEYTWYVRDAQGNVMAVYRANGSNLSTITLKLREHYIYGSSRLGVINRNMDVDQPRLTPDNGNANLGTAYLATFTRGDKLFEFTNHLGNVLFTATDAKVPKAKYGDPSHVGSYSVNMVTAVDYTPFGMIMQGMNYGSAAPGKYRYGFNGKEWDNSTKGNADQIDYGERPYDNRGVRFWSVDKLTVSYPYFSPYQFSGNNPIRFVDLDGLEQANPNAGILSDAPVLDPKYKNVNLNRTEIKADDVGSRFGIGLARTGVYTFAAITQMFGAAHYGSKVPKENFARQFPLIPNDNVAKDMILPIFTTPVALMMELKKDPTNAELWGEASGIFLLAKGGKFSGMFKSEMFGYKVDLMGGERSRYVNNYINYDIKAQEGIVDAVENFSTHFGKNTVGEIVANNPQASFLEHVGESLRSDGIITVRGQMNNKYFAEIWNGTAKGMEGYEIIPGSKVTGLSTKGYNRTDGTSLRGSENSLNEIKLIKKK